MDTGNDEAALLFREQADGRKVSRLPGGKVVLVDYSDTARIKGGERWLVRLDHREMFAIAFAIEKLPPLALPATPTTSTVVLERPNLPTATSTPTVTVSSAVSKQAPVAPGKRALPAMFVRPTDRVAIFVDGANMDGACREAGYFLDYFKVGEFFVGKGTFNAAYFYIADFTSKDNLQIRFLDFLAHSGYIVRKKAVKSITDKETGATIYKANVDTEVVLDMVNTADNYDVAFLLSGDSDYERCVDLLRSRGKRVYVVTSEGTIARELAHVADKPIFFIEDYRDLLARDDKAPGTP